ncbi:MAG TPA: ABC transporter substrate-binding protein [Xanthobacteraceae bacterium]|nr:ABC transporter substrate-binding protein [Xanthobacteraceae bacterium]
MKPRRASCLLRALAVIAAIIFAPCGAATAETTVTIGVVNDFAGWNPYADTTAQMYMIWCQTYGCLGTYNTNTGEYEPLLAESWETDKSDPRIWYFHLRHGLKRHHDGKELSADDVVHAIDRTKHDPHTAQVNNVHPIASAEAVDKYTVKITTTEPTAPLLDYIFDRLIITGKDLFDQYGAAADRKAPYGWGPYMIGDIAIGQRMVLNKNPQWPGMKPQNPDRIVFNRIQEAEPRITALLNGEVQIATAIPPHLAKRVEAASGVKAVGVPSVENMFLAMNPHFPPWNNKTLRQAVAYAIDREAIVQSVFQGRAEVLLGALGPGQIGYSPEVTPQYHYDPAKAKQLVTEAGFPNGVDIELFASADRYVNDRQSSQAIASMLTKVGIRTKLTIRDYSIEWPNVRKGLVPFYYQGRGSVIDPSPFLEQYFQSGVTPRLGYSNPQLDKLLEAERREFDPAQRKKLLLQVFNLIQQEVPAVFLWRINSLYGVSDKVGFKPHSDERIFGTDITVK